MDEEFLSDFEAMGLEQLTTAMIEDFVGIMRRMWKGETILGHDGPAGRYPVLSLGAEAGHDIPMTFTAFGPNSLALGGRAFDAVVLHTFFTDETIERCVRTVKKAAEAAGATPIVFASGPASRRSAIISPNRSDSRRRSVDWLRISRPTAISWSRPTDGTPTS